MSTQFATMAWIMDTYSMTKAIPSPVLSPANPSALAVRWAATSHRPRRVLYDPVRLRAPEDSVEGPTVAVQGFGMPALSRRNCCMKPERKSCGQRLHRCIYNRNGSYPELIHMKTSSSCRRVPESEPLEPAICWLELRHPGAGRLWRIRVHAENAATVRARIVAEAANGPLTPAADRILEAQGHLRDSDILCNGRRSHGLLLRVGTG